MRPAHLGIVRSLLSEPTAPFHEEAVAAEVARWAGRRGVAFTRDGAGNVLLECRKGPRPTVRWVFSAHMDHPGFVVRRQRGRRVRADFIGRVGTGHFAGARVRLFVPRRHVAARIVTVRKIKGTPWLTCRLELEAAADVPAGTIGMWDLPAVAVRGRRLAGRACDDLAGAAAVVCAIDQIVSLGAEAALTGLLTRAEEAAFIGAMAACENGSIPPGALLVAIETSSQQPGASLGDGVVVRAGDRVRTFDPSLTAHVAAVAARLAKRDRHFRWTRQLMPGGTCESTAYAMWGHQAAGLCIPLANYHNQGPRGRIAPERIDLGDFASLVKLLVALATDRTTPADTDRALRDQLRGLLASRSGYLKRGRT